jgi:uncharacterized Zn finger protein
MPAQLTEDIIRALSTPQSFERGQQYYRAGSVFNTSRQGDLLFGECEGSMAPTYRLQVELDEGGVRSAFCTCPYEMGGYCKHIVALLLAYLYTPEEFIERKGIDEMLAGLDREDLLELIHKMVENDHNLYDWLEMAIPVARTSSKAEETPLKEKRQSQVSAKAYQRQIRNILHSLDGYRMSEAYWMMGSMVGELTQIVHSAEAFLQAGDAEGAITILMVLLEEVADRYDQFDDSDGELGGFLDELGQPLAEAILSTELNETKRQKLKDDLEPILHELSDYGIDGTEVALVALEQGWTPGEADSYWETEDEDEWDEENGAEWYRDVGLTQAKLNVLERQGRTDEYLKLCQQTGEYRQYVLKLLELGRNDEAMLVALNHLTSAEDALSVAQKLRDLGQIWDAITMGERGLSLAGHKHSLGAWLGPLEEAQGRIDPAMQAYLAAFTSIPSLELYQTVMRLAGTNWNETRPRMMDVLQATPHSSVLADVYLLEGDWDGAIRVADQAGFWSYSLIEKVADAVLSHRPDWVILVSIKQAEGLIEKTQSKYYPAAARWLMKAKMAYLASDRQSEWQAYFSNLKTTYARRPALQRELRGL